jgi:hypothetical protein
VTAAPMGAEAGSDGLAATGLAAAGLAATGLAAAGPAASGLAAAGLAATGLAAGRRALQVAQQVQQAQHMARQIVMTAGANRAVMTAGAKAGAMTGLGGNTTHTLDDGHQEAPARGAGAASRDAGCRNTGTEGGAQGAEGGTQGGCGPAGGTSPQAPEAGHREEKNGEVCRRQGGGTGGREKEVQGEIPAAAARGGREHWLELQLGLGARRRSTAGRAATGTQDTTKRVGQVSTKRTAGDRPEQFQSALELPPAKSSFNRSQDQEQEKQGNHPYG